MEQFAYKPSGESVKRNAGFDSDNALKTFHEAIRTRNFTVTAQLRLTSDTDRQSVLQQADVLRPVVDAIQVTDNPGGSVHISTLSASSLLLQAGIDPIAQMTCRDRNKIALQSDLLGAEALGITSLLHPARR